MGGVAVDEKDLGRKLQLARKRAGLTQQALCQKAGLSYSTLAKIERGAIRSPSFITVANIASATGTPLEDLVDLGAEGASFPAPTDAKKRSKTGIRFVYFDVNGTLVRFYQRAFTQAARDLGVATDVVENLFWRYNDDLSSGRKNLEDFNRKISAELGSPEFDWHKYYMNNVQTMPGMDELLRWCAKYYEVGILSNNAPGFIDELKSKGLIPNIEFKTIVDSCKVGAVKPEAKIYEAAQELAAMEAGEILLVDDTRPFLTAADRAGWQVLWFDEMDPEDSITKIKSYLEF